MDKARNTIGFAGLLIVNFLAMFLIAGVGVYSYTVASVFDNMASVSMIFALECVARSVTIPLGGKLGDKIGHKKLFLGSLALYILSYAVCSFATGFWVFTIARMFSGFAWGLFMMNGFVLISAIFGQENAPRYSGYNQSLTTVAMIVAGPISGVVCAFNWRLQFWVALVLLVVGFFMCLYGIPEISPKKEKASFDIPGVVFTAVTLIPFSLAMNWGNIKGWTSPFVLTLLAMTAIGLCCLIIAEKKAQDPVFPFKLLRNRYYLAILMLMFIFSVLNGAANYLPSYAQAVLGTSSTVSGLMNVPGLLIAVFLTSFFGTRVAKDGKYRPMVLIWALASLLGSISWFFLSSTSSRTLGLVLLLGGAIPVGAVNSVNQIAPYTYPMKVLDAGDLATGLAFMGLAGAVGSTVSGGICGALLNSTGGLGAVYKLPIVCAVLMLIFAFMFRDIEKKK